MTAPCPAIDEPQSQFPPTKRSAHRGDPDIASLDIGLRRLVSCAHSTSMTPDQFQAQHPEVFLLDADDSHGIAPYLRARQLLAAGAQVTRTARAGDGNMNSTVRVSTTEGSLILKQSRPWVEKYPQIPAPWDRIDREAEFYQLVATKPALAGMMPAIRHFDTTSRILAMDDLGTGGDCADVYRGGRFSTAEISALASFLSDLHAVFAGSTATQRLRNREMRQLNHAHIFAIPLATDNGLNLDSVSSGLAEAARIVKSDGAFCREVERLGSDCYLADGPCLLHGDFFPGSIYRVAGGMKVIDPEFGFFGCAEFDVGVFLAHLLLARQSESIVNQWWIEYRHSADFDRCLVLQLAGVEIMRRLIGYAQLPGLTASLEEKRSLLEASRQLVLEPQTHPLHSLILKS